MAFGSITRSQIDDRKVFLDQSRSSFSISVLADAVAINEERGCIENLAFSVMADLMKSMIMRL
jgi:hypothetical protein